MNACVESSKGVLLGPEQHPDQSCKQTRACPDASASASDLERSFVAEVYECQAVRYASCTFSVKPCKKSTSVLRRADTELGFAPTNSPVVIRVPATGAQEQQRQQLPQRVGAASTRHRVFSFAGGVHATNRGSRRRRHPTCSRTPTSTSTTA